MKYQKHTAGLTLVELLLYVSLSSIILLTTIFFLGSLLDARIKNQTITEVEQQGMQIVHIMTQALRNAENVGSPAQGASAAALTLDVIPVLADPTIFDVQSGVIRIQEGTAAPIPLTNGRITASALTFQNLSRTGTPGTIRIQFTLSHKNPSGKNEYSYAKTFTASATLRHP